MAFLSQRATSAGDAHIDTLVIGCGQAGLAVSYHLTQLDHPHLVLERDRIGSNWLAKRWDSFTLVTPNWMNQLPGFPYQGSDPDGFLARDEIVTYLEDYAASFHAPLLLGASAHRLGSLPNGRGYCVETNERDYVVSNVVVTTGFHQLPKTPALAARISPTVDQLHAGAYRNPASLRPGAILVVGSAQSGCQIAEELNESGRDVYLSVGSAGREPRRYRGKDINHWFAAMGGFDRPIEDPTNPVERYRANPHCTGKNGGHALNLWNFAASGITLLGKSIDAQGNRLILAPDLATQITSADEMSEGLMSAVDDFIAASGLDVPPPGRDNTDDGWPETRPRLDEVTELDLAARGITTVIWATGFDCDFSWIDLPILDKRGYPKQARGVTDYPGLYFCGLHWMHSLKSGLFFGVGEDAGHVAQHLLNRVAVPELAMRQPA